MSILQFSYKLIFSDRDTINIDICVDESGLVIPQTAVDKNTLPGWTRLARHQCVHCPLNSDEESHCPLATNLVPVLDSCSGLTSFQEVEVIISSPERTYSKHTTIQQALTSLIGLIVPFSGCPHAAFLKPMARFHLPFASEQETIYRIFSMYLLSCIITKPTEISKSKLFEELDQKFQYLHIINLHLAERIRTAAENDSTVNAVVLLDLITKTVPYMIEDALEEIAYLFQE